MSSKVVNVDKAVLMKHLGIKNSELALQRDFFFGLYGNNSIAQMFGVGAFGSETLEYSY